MPESKTQAWALRLTDGTVFEFILSDVVPLGDGLVALKRGSTTVAFVPLASLSILAPGLIYSQSLSAGDEYRSARAAKSSSA